MPGNLFDMIGQDAATSQRREVDPCARKHGGNPQSAEAFERIADGLPERRRQVFEVIRAAGTHGATIKDVAAVLSGQQGRTVGLNQISGRITELRAGGMIADSGRRRDGCAVWVVEVSI